MLLCLEKIQDQEGDDPGHTTELELFDRTAECRALRQCRTSVEF